MKSASALLRPGDHAPAFSLRDPISKRETTLADFAGRNTILVFFRGTWCPFCRDQMNLLSKSYSRLENAGICLVGVVCQNPQTVERYLQANPLPFPLLPDFDRTVARAYGVHYWVSPEGFNLAKPSLFILDPDGVVLFSYVGRHMADLPVSNVLDKFVTFLPA